MTNDCYAIPCLTCKLITKGVLSESERNGDTDEWRLLLRADDGVADLSADLETSLRPGRSVECAQLAEPTYWTEKAVTVAELPTEQRTAVEAAVNRGYYETPREISLTGLAEELDLPRSTLQYRLQPAESWIIERFVRNSTLGDLSLALQERDSRTVTA